MKLLVVNIYFDPYSFGGATVVAEQTASRLSLQHGFEVTAVSGRFGSLPCSSVVRHRTRFGFEAFNVGVPIDQLREYDQRYTNTTFKAAFERILEYAQPDVAHVHCVQEIGAAFFDVLADKGIPFVVTVHDFWWLCERQFMIDIDQRPCDQRQIDLSVCARCSGEKSRVERRFQYLHYQLRKASKILAPSEFLRGMLIDNGFEADLVVVNKNGVQPPSSEFRRREQDDVVFGFVGGPGEMKGWNLIKAAFAEAQIGNFRLLAIDGGAKVDGSWRSELQDSSIPVQILPAYDIEDIDDVFSGMDVLLSPSLCKETFGLAVREALLRDVWVIASDAGGLAEDIVQGENGRILPWPPTKSALVKAIEEAAVRERAALPHKDRVTTIDEQTRELAAILRQSARRVEVA